MALLGRVRPRRPARALQQSTDARVRALAVLHQAFTETDWSRRHPEEALQSLESFCRQRRPNPAHKTIYLQPLGRLGSAQQKVVEETASLLGRWFGLPVKTLPPVLLDTVPAHARRGFQLQTGYLLQEVLLPRRPADAAAVLAVTESDLTPGEGWNFVFGQASLVERVGVWSLARLGDPRADYLTARLRFFKLATHETGHMFGLEHCLVAPCGMNGSNSLQETDRAPLAYCPECAAKLWHVTGVEPKAWFAGLEAVAREKGLVAEATLWKRSRERLGA